MEIVLRASAAFLVLWIVLRAMGKRELAELTTFELVLVITMGDLVQQSITQEDFSVTGAVLAIGTIALWIVASSYVGFRWRAPRPLLEGIPAIVVRDGKIMREVLRIERLNEEELLGAARQQGIESLSEISYGIVEADGKFTFLRRGDGAETQPRQERRFE